MEAAAPLSRAVAQTQCYLQTPIFRPHARDILHQDPHDTVYFGSKATGDFLRSLMKSGESRPWRDVLRGTTGRPLDAQAMVEYFMPLYEWLEVQNRGRTATLPD